MPSLSPDAFPRPARVVQVAPGVRVLPVEEKRVPSIVITELVWHRVTFSDGSQGRALVPVDRVHDRWMRLSEIEAKLRLGLSAEVIQKLWRGGFITGTQAAPNNILIDVVDLLRHIEDTAADPDYWTTELRNRYRDGIHGPVT